MLETTEPKWRSMTLAHRLAFAYTNELFTDVTIIVRLGGEEHLFKAHKNILAKHSPTMKETFYGIKEESPSLIELSDVDPQGVSYVLEQLYHVPSDPQEEIDRNIIISAQYAAQKLGLLQIEKDLKCEDLFTPNLKYHSSQTKQHIAPVSLLDLYTEQKHTDVCFIVGPGLIKLKAHRNILALGSLVFEKMFYGPLADTRYQINVTVMYPESFETMLKFFYDDSNPDSLFRNTGLAGKTFETSLRYGSINLKNTCLKYYTPRKLEVKTFWKQLESKSKLPATDSSHRQLLKHASEYTKEVLMTPGFLNASLEAVRCILELDAVSINEIYLLNSVAKWLEQNSQFFKSEKSKYELLRHIRFDDISSADFSSFLAKHGNVLSEDDSFGIRLHLESKTSALPAWCYTGPPRKSAGTPMSLCRLEYFLTSCENTLPSQRKV